MLSLEIYKKIPIPHVGRSLYSGLESKHRCFYFCNPECRKIVEYNECFEEIGCHQVKRGYTHISYCAHLECFLAITDHACNKIFKLNSCFEEVDCISVNVRGRMVFDGIDCKGGCIYLSCGCYIITLPLECLNHPEVWVKAEQRLKAVAKCPEYLLTSTSCCKGSSIVIYDNCQCLKTTCCLSEEYQVEDITCDGCYIYILVSKCHCYNFVLVCQIQKHCCPSPHQGCTDIIESIALIETSLSHILNAEGEKLQKIIATSDDPDTILEVNKAVNQTITNVTHLEHVLYSKLETAKDICEKKKK